MLKRVVRYKIFAILFLVILLLEGYYFIGKYYTPSIKLSDEMELSKDIVTSIVYMEQGYYNKHLPIFAQKITVLKLRDDRILYRVHYFPFGSIERSLTKESDGSWLFNLEKPLTGLS